jgi:hypothetical protein
MPQTLERRQYLWDGRGSAKVVLSKTLPCCDESPVYRIFVKTGDIPTTLTLAVRVLQQATDPFMHNHFPGRQWVNYGRGSAKVVSSKTLPCCDESPVHRIFVKTGQIPTTMTLAVRVLQQATDPFMHNHFPGRQ